LPSQILNVDLMNKSYSILVNSTDSYEDCWFPFFKLFDKYWDDKDIKIFLNTENKDYNYPGLSITSTKIGSGKKGRSYTWSESLLLALDKIETPLVLFVLDDLFFDDYVDTKTINQLAEKMIKNEYSVIYLTDQSTDGPFAVKGELLWELDQKANHRISALIALWKKESLKKYLRKHENPWQFEIYGTKRACYFKDTFFTLNQDIYNIDSKKVISHCYPTGIKRGRWIKEAVVDLFNMNDISIDFKKRGFYKDPFFEEKCKKPLSVNNLKSKFLSEGELCLLKLKHINANGKKIL